MKVIVYIRKRHDKAMHHKVGLSLTFSSYLGAYENLGKGHIVLDHSSY